VPENSGTGEITQFFGMAPSGYYMTGMGGSVGVLATDTAGGVVGNPQVSLPLASSQVPSNRPTLAVTAGDTSSMSDDQPVHESFLIPSHSGTTGIGGGSYGSNHSAARP
jgi:hypothetical protein